MQLVHPPDDSAKAKIDGKSAVVTSDHVASPIPVRYAYNVTPEDCDLYHRDGLPEAPFRSRPELLRYSPKLPQGE